MENLFFSKISATLIEFFVAVGKLNFIFLLMPLVVAFAVAQDIYISSMPQVTKSFHVNPGVTQWTISLFFLTTGIGQLLMGPLSDSYGRRRIILISSVII